MAKQVRVDTPAPEAPLLCLPDRAVRVIVQHLTVQDLARLASTCQALTIKKNKMMDVQLTCWFSVLYDQQLELDRQDSQNVEHAIRADARSERERDADDVSYDLGVLSSPEYVAKWGKRPVTGAVAHLGGNV
jgi:hypothetical protein